METNNLPELIRKYGGKISFMGGIENRAVDFEGWTDENCDAVVRRVCEECGNKYLFRVSLRVALVLFIRVFINLSVIPLTS